MPKTDDTPNTPDLLHIAIPADLKVEFYEYLDRRRLTVQQWTRYHVEQTLEAWRDNGASPLQTQIDHGGRYHAVIPISPLEVRMSRKSFASAALAQLYGALVIARWHDIHQKRCTCAHVEGDDTACPVHGGKKQARTLYCPFGCEFDEPAYGVNGNESWVPSCPKCGAPPKVCQTKSASTGPVHGGRQ